MSKRKLHETDIEADNGRGPPPDPYALPTGWVACPPQGDPIGNFIPIKVPLGVKFNRKIAPEDRFTPETVISQLRAKGIEVGLVLDLTNTSRYYDVEEWEALGVRHEKVRCRGRGEAPDPESVNLFVWIARLYLEENRRKPARKGTEQGPRILVHCTHGFNRTGFMIAHCLVRLEGKPLEEAVRTFARHRAPGIYKHDYIQTLFKYYHERRPSALVTPPVPEWKAAEPDSPARDGTEGVDEPSNGANGQMERVPQHDDVIGEAVDEGEAFQVRCQVIMAVNPDLLDRMMFPGSQPVSLARSNLELLRSRRYYVTWKADGTRQMLYITGSGTFAINRNFDVRRVQMRFPGPARPAAAGQRPPLVGPPHNNTLLDGEMVVDEDLETGSHTMRFLAYDLMAVNGKSIVNCTFKERFFLITKEVVEPRQRERDAIASGKHPSRYLYHEEPFRIRTKDFFPLTNTVHLLRSFIPNLCHEADGLILQGVEDPYRSGTCPELLKWKFAHLNSVDFQLHIADGDPQLLLKTRQKGLVQLPGNVVRLKHPKQAANNNDPNKDAVVDWPDEEDPWAYNGKIIECSWDEERHVWKFMRERKDKTDPNAYHVYEKVMASISDNITEDELLQYISETLELKIYEKDAQRARQAGGGT